MVESLVAQKSSKEIPLLKELILEEPRNILVEKPVKLVDALWGGAPEPAIGRLSRVAAARGVSIEVIDRSVDLSIDPLVEE